MRSDLLGKASLALAPALMLGSPPAMAQIISVTADTTVKRTFKSVDGPETQTLTGSWITGEQGNTDFGAGVSYQSASQVGADVIYFKNSNASAGTPALIDSYTVVTIRFRNDGATAIRPSFESYILPAGLGLFVGPNCLGALTSCGPDSPVMRQYEFGNFSAGLQQFSPALADARFDFRVTGAGTTLFDLSGSVSYLEDPLTGARSLVSDLDKAAATLNGFRQTSPDGSQRQFSFQWDATPVQVQYPVDFLLQPGEETTLTYETRVITASNTTCFDLLTNGCLNSLSSFGDPLKPSRTGPSGLRALAAPGQGGVSSLTFQTFRFRLPTFQDGTLSYQPVRLTGTVPEPATWAMMLAGVFGIGARLRWQRWRGISAAPG